MLRVDNVTSTLGGQQILFGVSVSFCPGEVAVIVGPNGSGKTTLLRIMSGELRQSSGTILYDGKPVTQADLPALAKKRAVLSQLSDLSFPMLAEEVVMMGRYPHFHVRPSQQDEEACDEAIDTMGLDHLRGRNYLTLSGGERQMVHFARVYAQIIGHQPGCTRYLLLDEPTTFLDIRHQHLFLRLVQQIAASGAVVVAVLHDIHLTARYANRIVALQGGRLLAEGQTSDVFTPSFFRELYGIDARVHRSSDNGFPLVIF